MFIGYCDGRVGEPGHVTEVELEGRDREQVEELLQELRRRAAVHPLRCRAERSRSRAPRPTGNRLQSDPALRSSRLSVETPSRGASGRRVVSSSTESLVSAAGGRCRISCFRSSSVRHVLGAVLDFESFAASSSRRRTRSCRNRSSSKLLRPAHAIGLDTVAGPACMTGGPSSLRSLG